MCPCSCSSRANSGANTECSSDGKYLRAFFRASRFCSTLRVIGLRGACGAEASWVEGGGSGSSCRPRARVDRSASVSEGMECALVEIRVSAVVRRHPSAATLTPSLNTSTIGGLHTHKHKTVACCWGLLNSCPMITIERLAMRNEGMATRTASDRRCVPMRGRRARSSRPSCRPRGFQPCRPGPARTRLQRAALRFSTGKWVNPPKKNTHRPPPRPAQHTAPHH